MSVRVLGYGFQDERAAYRALLALVERYELAPDDARVTRLCDDGLVLAVRAGEDILEDVKMILVEHGGEQLTHVDDRWRKRPDAAA